jgi:hypothetical protein
LKYSDVAPAAICRNLHEGVGRGLQHLVGCRGVEHQSLARLHQRIQGATHGTRRGLRRSADLADAQLGAVHAPRALD